jgi:ubiquinone/menaquinone biosynthesis C-methylase UbiE
MNDVELERLLTLFEAGQLSAPLTVARLLLVARDVTEVERWLSERDAGRGSVSHTLLRLIQQHRCGCESVAALGGFFEQHLGGERPKSSDVGAVFDRAVEVSEEASVALYSLGDARLLERATCEIVEQLRGWGLLGESRRTLEIGCGAGRMQKALARHVRLAAGVDVAAKMVSRARARCACMRNTRHEVASGSDLRLFPSASFDLVYGVDSFPYIVEGGNERVSRTFAEVARVLGPGGDFSIFNYSYRGDMEADVRDVAQLARAHGFELLAAGEKPFEIWDGVVFRLRRAGEAGSAA